MPDFSNWAEKNINEIFVKDKEFTLEGSIQEDVVDVRQQLSTTTITTDVHAESEPEVIMTGGGEQYRDKWIEEKIDNIGEKTELLIQRYDAENKSFLNSISSKMDATIQGISGKLDATIKGIHAESNAKIEGIKEQVSATKNTIHWSVALIVALFLGIGGMFLAMMGLLQSSKSPMPPQTTIERK
jgi:gas vesicle protein